MLRLISKLCIASLIISSPAAAELPREIAIERNRIDAGDYSTNIIASGGSIVYIMLDSDFNEIRVRREDVLREIKKQQPELIGSARAEFPNKLIRFIETVAIAKHMFELGQYSLAASLYKSTVDQMTLDETGYNKLEGFVNASLYGSGRHVQALRFICEQYEFRPKWSHRFRHWIHAHLRGLAVKFDHDYALKVLGEVRQDPKCQRDDFTAAWIPIHLYDMRWLEGSTPPEHAEYGFSTDADTGFARQLIREGIHPFTDYLLFIDGRYKEVLERFPKSYIRDLALLGLAETSSYEVAKPLLLSHIKTYENNRNYAVKLLLRKAGEAKDRDMLGDLLSRFPEPFVPTPHGYISFWLTQTISVGTNKATLKDFTPEKLTSLVDYYTFCPTLQGLFEDAKLTAAIERLRNEKEIFENLFLTGPDFRVFLNLPTATPWLRICLAEFDASEIDTLLTLFAPIEEALRSRDMPKIKSYAQALKLCGDYREGIKKAVPSDPFCMAFIPAVEKQPGLKGLSLHKIAAKLFRIAYEASPDTNDDLLFAEALTHRNNNDYEKYVEVLREYITYFPDGSFVDDAYTEIGWYHLAVKSNYKIADRFFERVLRYHPRSNAYDNALNWLVVSKRAAGDYVSALGYSVRLLVEVTSQRIRSKAEDRHDALAKAVPVIDRGSHVYVLGEYYDGGFGIGEPDLVILEVNGSLAELKVGDIIKDTGNSTEFFLRLRDLLRKGFEHVEVNVRPKDRPRRIKEVRLPILDFGVNREAREKPIARSTSPSEPSVPPPSEPTFGLSPTPGTSVISFEEGRFVSQVLDGDEFRDQGISNIESVVSSGSCAEAQPAVLRAGRYRAPRSFLSTALPGDLKRCNTMPLSVRLSAPARKVRINFYGANTPYELRAYRANGSLVAARSKNANPYTYDERFSVAVSAPSAEIVQFEFGHQAALTMVRSIEVER